MGCNGWLADCFFFFPSPTHGFVWSVEWRWVVLFRSIGGVGGSMEWWWVGFCQFVSGCLDLLGCEIWRLKFHFTGFEFNFLDFKFAGFVFLFKYVMCSCLIYQFYLGLSRMLAWILILGFSSKVLIFWVLIFISMFNFLFMFNLMWAYSLICVLIFWAFDFWILILCS